MDEDNKLLNMEEEAIANEITANVEELFKRNTWKEFDAPGVAEGSLQLSNDYSQADIREDDQARAFRKFVSIATNFSSLPLSEKLHEIPCLITTVKELFDKMLEEVKEYGEINNECRDLMQCFTRMVMETQHNANMIIPILTSTTVQLEIVQDVMQTDEQQELNQIDRNDIDLALSVMFAGIENLRNFAKTSAIESKGLAERIHGLTKTVSSKKSTTKERLEICGTYFMCGGIGAPAVGALSAGACIASGSFGGVGAMVIAGVAFPPIAAVVGAIILGGMASATAIILVKHFWVNQQVKALKYLTAIFEYLLDLNSMNEQFMQYMNQVEEATQALSENMKGIQICLQSKRQRKYHGNVCQKAIESTNAVINSLKKIVVIDINELVEMRTEVDKYVTFKSSYLPITKR